MIHEAFSLHMVSKLRFCRLLVDWPGLRLIDSFKNYAAHHNGDQNTVYCRQHQHSEQSNGCHGLRAVHRLLVRDEARSDFVLRHHLKISIRPLQFFKFLGIVQHFFQLHRCF